MTVPLTPPMTMAERLMARAAGVDRVAPGDMVDCALDGVMVFESFVDSNERLVESGLRGGIQTLWDPDRVYAMLEHVQPPTSLRAAERAQGLRRLAERLGITHFHDTTSGICHQMMVDHGYVGPGQFVVGSDSHACMYGALNCAGTGIGELDVLYAVTAGELWFMVPWAIRLELTGVAPAWPVAKDVMLHLAGRFGEDFALYRSIEVGGPGVASLGMDARFTIADHGVEVGAKFALFEADETTYDFLRTRVAGDVLEDYRPVAPDAGAQYERVIEVDLSELPPQVAVPHEFDAVVQVGDVIGKRIDQAMIGSCANGRFEDIELAARVLEGRRVDPRVRLLVSPASNDVYRQCIESGVATALLDAGAQLLDPGCELCLGLRGYLAPGEVALTSTTRNYRGRLGSAEAEVYLANPATVAWSAVTGVIADPREVLC